MLSRLKGRDVWFCHLASAIELRQAIFQKERTVRGCIAADDLLIEKRSLAEQIASEDRYLNKAG